MEEDKTVNNESAKAEADRIIEEAVIEEVLAEEVIIEDEAAEPDLLKQCEDYKDKWQRALADYDNFRKRTIKEKASMYDDGVRNTVEKLLPSIDNFERALNASTNKADSFYKGVEMIYRQMLLALDDIGVEAIEAAGEKFDPALHHAVAHVEDQQYGENEVIDVLQKGYKYKEKVIRPCMVRVAN